MKSKVFCFAMLFAIATVALPVSGGPANVAKKRAEISAGERALAMLEVQNCMSKHAYYHQIGAHCDEIADLWVKENGAYAKTAKWTSSFGVEQGIDLIKQNYCINHFEDKKKILADLSKVNPEIKNVQENIGAGTEYVIHTQTTPIIEVAGDGKTAKGVWYSPGLAVRGSVVNGKATISTGWMWEKYAVDFVKEDEKWKIWHFQNIMDPGPVDPNAPQGMSLGGPPPGGGGPKGPPPDMGPQGRADTDAKMEAPGGGRKFTGPNPDPYEWSPTKAPRMYPRMPEPYYTFNETFSY